MKEFLRFLCFYLFFASVFMCSYAQEKEVITGYLKVRTKPGRYYQLGIPKDDGAAVGSKWTADKSDEGVKSSITPNPLEPMLRKRFLIKADDLATWSLEAFKRFAQFIEKHDAKAGFGIIPGRCNDSVFEWVRTLDPERFEIWNHTWTHGSDGPNHYHQPYDVQWRNLTIAHDKVKEKTGIVMHVWCGGGIKLQGKGVHDQDDVTHWVIRNHPDYKVHYHADPKFADRGLGNINSDGIFMPWRHSWFENEEFPSEFAAGLKARWPEINWSRPSALGNEEELKWRFDHPHWHVPDSGQVEISVGQFHPTLWDEEKLKALGQLLEYIKSKRDWRFANAYETYQWLMDRNDISIIKIGPTEYRLDVKSTRFEHVLELRLPPETTVLEHIYHVGAFPPK